MGVVAPLSALTAAVIPVMIGVALGDRPTVVAWSGVLLALAAIWLVSTSVRPAVDGGPVPPPLLAAGVRDGLLAGVAFALLFVSLKLAGDGSGLWPVVASQSSSLAVLTVVLFGTVSRPEHIGLAPRDLVGAASVGAFGGSAVVLYFLSSQAGLLSIVAVLTSLYPAATVLLAIALLREAISRRQSVGLLLAGASVVLIVIG
jgi:drug/metabolite transporter (DMT)-like permease